MANKTSPVKIGDEIGRLIVVAYAGVNKHRKRIWECFCQCGNTVVVVGSSLQSGLTSSCGCKIYEPKTHGGTDRPEYKVWASMLSRCNNPNDTNYRNYGARGIRVHERWRDFANFILDMGERPSPKHSLDRKDNNGNYEPTNCRWATKQEQDSNRRTTRLLTLNGETKCATEWARITNQHPAALLWRLDNGWTVEEAILTPSGKQR